MDIRKWFTSSKVTTSGDNQTHSKNAKGKKLEADQKKPSKKRRIIESDSDEDPIPQQKKKGSPETKKSPKKSIHGKSKKDEPVEAKKILSVSDFFGSAAISRSSKQEIPLTKKIKEDIHEDDDFQETLLKLDTETPSNIKKVNGEKKNSSSENNKEKMDKTCLSSRTKDISENENSSKGSKGKDKNSSTSSNKEGKPLQSKRKPKIESTLKIEVTPNEKKPALKTVIEEKKPPAKKPRSSGGGASYASYVNREGPRALGSKEIPEGEEDCLSGLTFIITGVLESLERDDAKALIEKYGGKVMTTLSKKTKYMVIGRDAGSSKLDKAEKLGTKQVDEDGLLDLIRTMSGKVGTGKTKQLKKDVFQTNRSNLASPKKTVVQAEKNIENDFEIDFEEDVFSEKELELLDNSAKAANSMPQEINQKTKTDVTSKQGKEIVTPVTSMWVDKYKPTNLKQIIGQQGTSSNAQKLLRWLLNWHKSRHLNKKPIHGRFNTADDGSAYKAALLSGPPGVGKTTTAVLVCKEARYDFFELNASDTRSKKSLQQTVSQLLGNQTLADCFKDNGSGKVSNNHVIVMDEVDGMAGNEDRGGMGELIGFIKASKVPIICICNDRNHQKIRSLANYCFDLRFQRPRVEQIKASMLSIACKEHLQVAPDILQDIIVASNQDIRQVLHNMSMWSANNKGLSSEQTKHDIGKGTKHIKMGPFDVLREVFAIGNNPKATIMDKSDLFFHDYSLAPLFVQENYLHVIPTAAGGNIIKHLTLLSEAADSICYGDIIDRQIRSQSSWGLLPTQAIFASVVPGELLRGHLRQMINFPVWLGKNSNRNHMDRVLQELHVHMRMRVTGNKTDIALEYLPLLKRALTKPLVEKEQAGIPEVLKTMEEYYLLREDFDSIIDLSLWSGQTDPRTKIQTKVKSAFTRSYNKESGKNPYAVTNIKKKKGSSVKDADTELEGDEAVESEEEEDDDIEKDAMIKVKKPAKKDTKASDEPSTSSKNKKNPSKRGKAK